MLSVPDGALLRCDGIQGWLHPRLGLLMYPKLFPHFICALTPWKLQLIPGAEGSRRREQSEEEEKEQSTDFSTSTGQEEL